eukprot:scaffold40019_cov48-Phaeocystis_antarctica.AAC.1
MTFSRGTGGLSDGGSAQGARAAAGCAEREPARDPSRVRRGAVCAEAGHSPEGRSPRAGLKMYLLFVCLFKRGGYCQATKPDDDRLNDRRQAIL